MNQDTCGDLAKNACANSKNKYSNENGAFLSDEIESCALNV